MTRTESVLTNHRWIELTNNGFKLLFSNFVNHLVTFILHIILTCLFGVELWARWVLQARLSWCSASDQNIDRPANYLSMHPHACLIEKRAFFSVMLCDWPLSKVHGSESSCPSLRRSQTVPHISSQLLCQHKMSWFSQSWLSCVMYMI